MNRQNYEMTEADLESLYAAMKPVPMIMLQCGTPPSRQENANRAWKALGKRMGFDHMTVQPTGRGDRFFSAVPVEGTVVEPVAPPPAPPPDPDKEWVPVSSGIFPQNQGWVLAHYRDVYSHRIVTFWKDAAGNPHFGDHHDPDGKGSQPATHWRNLPEVP